MQIYEKCITFVQDTDTWQSSEENCQQITVRTHAVPPEGHYVTIETTRWALDLDEIDKFCSMLKQLIIDLEKQDDEIRSSKFPSFS